MVARQIMTSAGAAVVMAAVVMTAGVTAAPAGAARTGRDIRTRRRDA
jgi:hypothetical protein